MTTKPKAKTDPVAKTATATSAVTTPPAKAKTAKPTATAAKPQPKAVEVEAPSAIPIKKPSKKAKPVRDSFTFPADDYARFAQLKQRALAGGAEVKKSELIRAGLTILSELSDVQFFDAIGKVERIKTGRPTSK